MAKLLFEGLPVAAVLGTLAVAFVIFGRQSSKNPTKTFQKVFVASFIVEKLGFIISGILTPVRQALKQS